MFYNSISLTFDRRVRWKLYGFMLSATEDFFVKGNWPERKLTKFFSLSLNGMIHRRKRLMLHCFHEIIMLKEKYFVRHPLLTLLTSCAVLLITKWIVLWKQPLIQLIKFLLRILTVNDFYLIILQWEPSWCLFSQLKHGGNLIQLIILIQQRDLSIYVVTDFNIVMLFSNICKPLY